MDRITFPEGFLKGNNRFFIILFYYRIMEFFKKKNPHCGFYKMAAQAGIEPATHGFSVEVCTFKDFQIIIITKELHLADN
jgi:hypothetical protein